MKHLLRSYIIDTYCLYIVSTIASGMEFKNGYYTLFLAGGALMGASYLAKPVINILLLPLNMITFGLFRWVSSAVVLYLVTLIIRDFKILYFKFGGLNNKWIDIPPFYVEGVFAFISFAFILSILTSFLYWLTKK